MRGDKQLPLCSASNLSVGHFCQGNGECGTDPALDNCDDALDVYERVDESMDMRTTVITPPVPAASNASAGTSYWRVWNTSVSLVLPKSCRTRWVTTVYVRGGDAQMTSVAVGATTANGSMGKSTSLLQCGRLRPIYPGNKSFVAASMVQLHTCYRLTSVVVGQKAAQSHFGQHMVRFVPPLCRPAHLNAAGCEAQNGLVSIRSCTEPELFLRKALQASVQKTERWVSLFTCRTPSSSAFTNQFLGWYTTGHTGQISSCGKSNNYDSASANRFRFRFAFTDGTTQTVEISLQNAAKRTMLQLVQESGLRLNSAGAAPKNLGTGKWKYQHMSIPWSQPVNTSRFTGKSLRLGVGDGGADSRDFAVFMFLTGNGKADFAGQKILDIGGESRTVDDRTVTRVDILGYALQVGVDWTADYKFAGISPESTEAYRWRVQPACGGNCIVVGEPAAPS